MSILNYDKSAHTNIQRFFFHKIFPQRVKRRYNHFDWLHERLTEKYPNICIPPLSGKAVTGNFDDEFIAKRKAQLELWLNRMAAHPVVGQSEVFIHFLQCDEGSAKWKAGKRKAEKDEYHGAQWFCTLTVPGESVDTTNGIKERVDKFSKAANNLNNCIKNASSNLERISVNNSKVYKKELTDLGKRFEEMGVTLSNDSLDAINNSKLSAAMVSLGNAFGQIGNMYGEQAKHDINPLLDRFQLYQGILQEMPGIVQIEKSAIQAYEEFQVRPEKLEGRTLMEVAPRREIISHVTFAEINQFNRDKVDDLTAYMKTFLSEQIKFHTEITECMKRALSEFEKIPVQQSNTAQVSSSQSQSFRH
jgi:sorting nexin-9/18/33